jgi:hypothetical protein
VTALPPEHQRVADLSRALLILAFGASTVLVIRLAADAPIGRGDLLLFAASAGAIVTALLWVLLLAIARGPGWALVMGLGVWIPYVNLVLAGVFARRYWSQGGRGPALLGILGMVGQTVASIRLLVPKLPPLV